MATFISANTILQYKKVVPQATYALLKALTSLSDVTWNWACQPEDWLLEVAHQGNMQRWKVFFVKNKICQWFSSLEGHLLQNLGRVIVLCITLSVSRVIVEEFWPSFFFLQCGFRSLRSAGSPKISRQCFNEVEVWTLKLCRFTSATGTAIPHLLILSVHSSIQSQRMLKSVQMSPTFCRANLYRPPYFNGLRIS